MKIIWWNYILNYQIWKKREKMYLQSQAKMLNNRVNMLKNQEKKNLQKIEGGKKLVNNKILHFNKW